MDVITMSGALYARKTSNRQVSLLRPLHVVKRLQTISSRNSTSRGASKRLIFFGMATPRQWSVATTCRKKLARSSAIVAPGQAQVGTIVLLELLACATI